MKWRCRDRVLTIGPRPLIMAILNVTPDSFSDGGRFADPARAVEHGLRMAAAGADIVDIGGQSTRPGAEEVPGEEELRRVQPVVEALCAQTDVAVSIDTMKAPVARRALEAGACIINDVSALTADPDMVAVARETGAGCVLMHMQGTPRTMQTAPRYGDVVAEVTQYLRQRAGDLERTGISRETLAVDPGFGFGKNLEHNLGLLAHLDGLTALGMPVVVGVSRKSMLEKLTGRSVEDRLAGSLAALVCSVLGGAHVVRVHDVAESLDAARVAAAWLQAKEGKSVRVE